MENSIENIWKEGFLKNENRLAPKLNNFYNQKSKHLVDRILHQLKMEVWLSIPIAIGLFFLNIFLDNDNSIFWGIVSAAPCFFWFYLGSKQIQSLKNIDYGASCYEYIISINQKLKELTLFNKKLAISFVPIILFPMLIYTYFNNYDKTIGEIFGIENLNWSNLTLFLLLPIFTFLNYIMVEVFYKRSINKNNFKIGSLIKDMEELRK